MNPDTRSLDQITAEASDWFIAQRTGTLSPAEREQFTTWLESSPVHVREYLAIADAWGAMKGAAASESATAEALRAAAAGAGNVVTLGRTRHDERRRPTRRRLPFGVAAAAVLALASVVAVIVSMQTRSAQTYATARGEQRSIALEDGSVIQLNTLSRVVVQFDEARRRVELKDGEAFFRVAHDPGRPFDVVTSIATVRAVGTQFNVYRRNDKLKVDVIEGRVRVAAGGSDTSGASGTGDAKTPDSVLVAANEVVQVQRGGPLLRERSSTTSAATTWMQRKLTFENERLDDVVREFNRYTTRQLRLVGTDLASLHISGVFEADQPETLIAYLEQVQNVSVSNQGTTIVLARRDRSSATQ